MKATDLLQLVTEREDGAIGKVSYKNDKTPDNHVKNKKMKEVNPLPDKGEKKDKHPKANVGDVRGKERRSMEGPKTGVKKMAEQAPSTAGMVVKELDPQGPYGKFIHINPRQPNMLNIRDVTTPNRPWLSMPIDNQTSNDINALITKSNPQEVKIVFQSILSRAKTRGSNVAGNLGGRTSGRSVGAPMSQQQIAKAGSGWQLEDEGSAGIEVDEIEPEEIEAMPAGMDVRHEEPEEITMKGHAPQREGLGESGVENTGSMKRKVPVQKGRPVSRTTSVRTGQKDDPKPTADVGKPKKKEKRSMDANKAPVQDWKGGENEHKKMGMHEGIKELEKLLNRKIDTTFLEGDVDEAWDLRKAEKAAAAKSKPIATGSIKRAAEKGRKAKVKTTAPGPGEKAPEGSFWSKAGKHMEGY